MTELTDELLADAGERMTKSLEATRNEFGTVRTGRASPGLLELTYRLSRRYLGPEGPRYAQRTIDRPRVLVRLEPVTWTTWTGPEWHPRYR